MRAQNPYDGNLMRTFEDAVVRAERNSIDGGDQIPQLALVTTPVRNLSEWIADQQKFDEYFEHRCLECEREVPKVPGTDHCMDCLAKIQAEDE